MSGRPKRTTDTYVEDIGYWNYSIMYFHLIKNVSKL